MARSANYRKLLISLSLGGRLALVAARPISPSFEVAAGVLRSTTLLLRIGVLPWFVLGEQQRAAGDGWTAKFSIHDSSVDPHHFPRFFSQSFAPLPFFTSISSPRPTLSLTLRAARERRES